MTYRIITVCTGNICRSPMAAALLRARLDEAGLQGRGEGGIEITSAAVTSEEIGNPMDPRAARVLAAHGVEDAGHRAHRITAEEAAGADLLIAMDHDHVGPLQRLLAEAEGPGAAEEAAAEGGRRGRLRLIRSFDPAVTGDDLGIRDPWYGGAEDFDRTWEQLDPAVDGILEHLRGELDARA